MRAIAAFLFASGLWSAVLIDPVSSQQPEAPLKIGLLDDFSSVYSHIGGVMDLEAAKMAIEDFGGVMFGKPIQLVSADALNKPDIAASIAGVPAAVELDVLRHGASFRYQFLNGRGRDTHTSGSGVLSQRPPPRLPRPAALPRLAVESSRGHPDPFSS